VGHDTLSYGCNRVGVVLLPRPTGPILFLTIATLGAAISAYAAASVSAYVVQPRLVKTIVITAEPQLANRTAKADRVALLLNSPSYLDFSPSLLVPSISSIKGTFDGRGDLSGSSGGLLNDAQIAGIESRLKLTQRQAEYWPAVAGALRDISRKYFLPRQRRPRKIDMNSAEVRRLIETATPLILLLSEDQKREVRQLVRLIGLETVASRI
jgi:hypothetical protein